MPKLTYKPLTADDPSFTSVGSYRFEANKAVEVPDAVYDKLSQNPWFSGDKKRAERLTAGGGISPGPSSGIDSSVMPANPPGSGMKYGEDTAMTAQGIVPSADVTEADMADNATTVEDPKDARKGGRVPNKG